MLRPRKIPRLVRPPSRPTSSSSTTPADFTSLMQERITSLHRTRVIGNSDDSSAKEVSGHCGNICAEGVQPEASGLPLVSVDLNPETLCSRCATFTSYRSMYSVENLQHLGPRHSALFNLTWYETLLIARVHDVISVVILTATGLLCYAGHGCNYYQKVYERFRGLPKALRDKKWFLIKRRRSV